MVENKIKIRIVFALHYASSGKKLISSHANVIRIRL